MKLQEVCLIYEDVMPGDEIRRRGKEGINGWEAGKERQENKWGGRERKKGIGNESRR